MVKRYGDDAENQAAARANKMAADHQSDREAAGDEAAQGQEDALGAPAASRILK
jgi:hypothetical protein